MRSWRRFLQRASARLPPQVARPWLCSAARAPPRPKNWPLKVQARLAPLTSTASLQARLLPNTLILREGASRYTTGFGIKIPILIPKNDLGHRIPAEFRRKSVSESRAALLRAHFSGRRPTRPLRATQRALVAWLRIGQPIDRRPPPHTWRCGCLRARG